ncbi:MAG: HupE/UreJ family protein [Rhodanobacteraceae bacterium]
MSAWPKCIALLALAGAASPANAHKPSDSYLTINVSSSSGDVSGHWDIALRDLEIAIGLDANGDDAITWGELRRDSASIFDHALARLDLRADGTSCVVSRGDLLADTHSDGGYAVLNFTAHCAAPVQAFGVDYRLLFDIDPSHRGLLNLDLDGVVRTAVLSPSQSAQAFDLAHVSRGRQFLQFVADGVHHIWIGYDHLLFLISLLLPAVLIRCDGRWIPVGTLKSALLSVIAVVTAFTVSHSITLTLAALGVMGLPSRLVESGIALSVLLAALNNVWPQVTRRAWILAFAFGLVHGFGFASVLNDLGLPRDALALSLAGFNIGVELGQLAVVLVVVPLIFELRERRLYRPAVLVGGSAIIAVVAATWFVQRALGFGLG